MFARPLAPFRMRPLRRLIVRKLVRPEQINAIAEETMLFSVKGSRSPLKVGSRLGKATLRVLKDGRAAEARS